MDRSSTPRQRRQPKSKKAHTKFTKPTATNTSLLAPLCPLYPRIRRPQPFQHMLLNRNHLLTVATTITPVKRPQLNLCIAVKEEGHRVAVVPTRVDDPVRGTLVDASCPEGEHVTDIDDVCVGVGRYGMPCVSCIVEDLEAAGYVLEEEGDGALRGGGVLVSTYVFFFFSPFGHKRENLRIE